jgi:hypothetical protein
VSDKGNINSTLIQVGNELAAELTANFKLDVGKSVAEFFQDTGEKERCVVVWDTQADRSGNVVLAYFGKGLVVKLKDADCKSHQGFCGFGQSDTPVGAVKEFVAEMILQATDLGADRGLCQSEPFGGMSETVALGNSSKCSQ